MWTTSTHVTDNETATQLSFINCGGGSTVDPPRFACDGGGHLSSINMINVVTRWTLEDENTRGGQRREAGRGVQEQRRRRR